MKPSTINLQLNFDQTHSANQKNLQHQSENLNNEHFNHSIIQTPNFGYDPFISAQMQMIELYTPDATESEKTFSEISDKSTKSGKEARPDTLSLSSILDTDHKTSNAAKSNKNQRQDKSSFYLHEQKKPKFEEMQHSCYEEDFYIDPVLINDRDGFSTAASDNSSDDTFETYESMMENLDDFEVNDNYKFQKNLTHTNGQRCGNDQNPLKNDAEKIDTHDAKNLPKLRTNQNSKSCRQENVYSNTMDEFLEAEVLSESFCLDESPIVSNGTRRQDSMNNKQENGFVQKWKESSDSDGLLTNIGVSKSTGSSPRLNRSKRIDLEKFNLSEILDGNLSATKHNQDELFGSSSPMSSGSKKSLDRKRLSKKTRHEMLFASCDIECSKSIFPQEEYQIFSASFDADSGFSTDRDVKTTHEYLRNSPSPQRLKNISENNFGKTSPTKTCDDFEKLSRTSSPSYNLSSSLRNTPSPERVKIEFTNGRSSPTKNSSNKKSRNNSPNYHSSRNTPSPQRVKNISASYTGRTSPDKKPNSPVRDLSKGTLNLPTPDKNKNINFSARVSSVKNKNLDANNILAIDRVVNSSNDSESDKTLDDDNNYLKSDLPYDSNPMFLDYNPFFQIDSESSPVSRHRGQQQAAQLTSNKHHQHSRESSQDKVRLK